MKLWFKRVCATFIEYQQKRADFMVLQMLTDDELRDIGVTRHEIKEKFYGKI